MNHLKINSQPPLDAQSIDEWRAIFEKAEKDPDFKIFVNESIEVKKMENGKQQDYTDELISNLTRALTFKYASDGTKPGVTISYLPHNKSFYVSLLRWNGGDKNVIFRTQGTTLSPCLMAASSWLIEEKSNNPLDDLRATLNCEEAEPDQEDWTD